MPTVPVVDQTAIGAQPFAAPDTARFRSAAPEQMVQTGQSMQQTGSVAFRTGQTIGNALADQVDDARVKQGEAAFLSKANDLLYGDTGYLNTRGQAAIDGSQGVKSAVSQAANDAVEGAGNKLQEHMLRQLVTQHLVSFGRTISLHNADQTRQYATESAVGRANTFAGSASNAFAAYGQVNAAGERTGDFATNIAVAENETLHAVGLQKGAPPESDVAKEALLNLHTQVGSDVLSQMMDGRASYAKVQRTYQDMKDKGWLSLHAMTTLGRMVKTYSEQEATRDAINRNLSDAYRASQNQPTTSTGTPDYQFGIRGGIPQAYDPEKGSAGINVPQGTTMQAPADGKVIQAGLDDANEFALQLQHADGSITSLTGLAAANVKTGDTVKRGEPVAVSGPFVRWALTDKARQPADPTKAGLAPVDLTKITDESVLGDALSRLRSEITDPYLQQQATSEMESVVRRNQQMANAQQAQVYRQASENFYANNMNWRAIPPALFNQLTAEQQHDLKEKQQSEIERTYNYGQFLKNSSETDIVSDFYANPDALTTANVEAARPHLSNSTYLSLLNRADQQSNNPKGAVEAQNVADRIKFFAGNAGVNIAPNRFDTEGKQKLNALHYAVDNAIDQIKTLNNGRATAQQVDEAIKQQVIQHTLNVPRAALSPMRLFGSDTTPEVKYNFQIPAGATHTAMGSDGKLHYTNANGEDLGVAK